MPNPYDPLGSPFAAVQSAADNACEPTVVVLGAGESAGVVVVDAQQHEPPTSVEFVQSVDQHAAGLLPVIGGDPKVTLDGRPTQSGEEGLQVTAGQFVQDKA